MSSARCRLRHTRPTKSEPLFARYDASSGHVADRPVPRALPTAKVETSRIWYLALALLIGIGVTAGLAGAALALDLHGYRVTRPGEVLFRHAARRADLAALPESEVRAWCGAPRQRWPTHGISRNVYNGQQPGETFAWTMMTGAAAAFALDDAAARRAVVGNLTRWAKGGALSRFKKDPAASMYYNLDRTLLPIIVAFSLVRDHPDFGATDRGLVAAWLDRLVDRRGPGRPKDPALMSSQNNHGYLGDSVTMAWGIVRGEDALFRTGVARFVGALDQMRPDGSLPLETARGARALHYQRHAISSLVAIAEMAATQGYDLYRLESENQGSLRRAIDFLLAAIEDPALVLPYAQANRNPGPFNNYLVQDLGFMAQRGHGRHYMAWAEPYVGRFPDSATSRRLGDLLAEFGAERPLIDEFSGGNMSCFFALAR
jgi:poly(beta-D-mannuronate) lyase